MKYLIMLVMLLAPFTAEAAACDAANHPIYCRILKLNPRVNKDFAFRLSNIIHKEASKYNIDPMLSLAILMQENSFNEVNTFRVEEHIDRHCDEKNCYEVITKKKKAIDLGIAQINVRTALHYGLDINRLFDHDLEYAIQGHFRILSDKIRSCSHLGPEAWTCYHSATEDKRNIYLNLVERFLPKRLRSQVASQP